MSISSVNQSVRKSLQLLGLLCILSIGLQACTSVPSGVQPVQGFNAQRYLGQWYEIARLDHSFERGLRNVSATYSMREDGGIRVLNQGVNIKTGESQSGEGKAYFVSSPDIAHLKVSFFGPFYGSYIVFELDHEGYQYAMISGPDKSYFWILARQPKLDSGVLQKLIAKAQSAGFDTSALIYPEHQ